jgi:hypothetical protein
VPFAFVAPIVTFVVAPPPGAPLKVSVAGGVLGASDFFAMSNVSAENNQDADLGPGGALLLPDTTD